MVNHTYPGIPSPSFILEERLLKNNLETIKKAGQLSGVEIILALKGFAAWKSFPLIKEYIQSAAASSLHEARLIYEELGLKAHTYCPAFREEDFKEICMYSETIIFNSLAQYNRFQALAKEVDPGISIGLRVNPGYSPVKTDLYNPASGGSRLGISATSLPDKLPEGIEGLHFHALCESNAHDLEKVLASFEQKYDRYLGQLKWVNMGGGHLFTSGHYDLEHFHKITSRFSEKYNLQLIAEPGAAFVWRTGVLKATVIDLVDNDQVNTAMLDVSFTAHMPDCLEMPYKPVIRGAVDGDDGKYTYRMGGNSCLAGDFTGNYSFRAPLRVGDVVIFEDMMHYTMVKTTMFNGVNHPSIYLLNEDNSSTKLRQFGYQDYKGRLC